MPPHIKYHPWQEAVSKLLLFHHLHVYNLICIRLILICIYSYNTSSGLAVIYSKSPLVEADTFLSFTVVCNGFVVSNAALADNGTMVNTLHVITRDKITKINIFLFVKIPPI